MTTATSITVDALAIERFIVEVDALASFEAIRNGSHQGGPSETWLVDHIYGLLDKFEKATLGNLLEEEANKLHDRGVKRGGELFAQYVRDIRGADDAR